MVKQCHSVNVIVLGQQNIPRYYFKYPLMYKFIALITTQHVVILLLLNIQVSNGPPFEICIIVLSLRTSIH